MKVYDYLEAQKGTGVLATADKDGKEMLPCMRDRILRQSMKLFF